MSIAVDDYLYDYWDEASPVLDDGFGNAWAKCGPECDMQIVRPGKVQCSGNHCNDLNGWTPTWDDEEVYRR